MNNTFAVCGNGTFGANCEERCSPNCAGTNQTCDPLSGRCLNGCVSWFGGDMCDINILLIVGIVLAIAAVGLFILLGLYFRNHWSKEQEQGVHKEITFIEPSSQADSDEHVKKRRSFDKRTDTSIGSSYVSSHAATSKSLYSSEVTTSSYESSVDPFELLEEEEEISTLRR